MKSQHPNSDLGPRALLALLLSISLGLLSTTPLAAQTTDQAAEPVKPAEKPKETVLELSPFIVSAGSHEGYLSKESLLGSRIKTPLTDTASSITILTPEFMQDIGAKTIYDALDYTTSANVDETGIRFHNSFQTAAVRVRGIQAFNAFTQDFFKSFWVSDSYNTSDMGLARGANSILFGVGNPAGVFTATAKRALFSNFNEVSLKFDTWGSQRGEGDFNVQILKDRLALRVALLDEDRRYVYEPAWSKTKAAYGAFTAKLIDRPAFKTTLSGNYEHREADRVFGQQWTTGNAFTAWLKSGGQTFAGAEPGVGYTNAQLNAIGLQLSGEFGANGGTSVILGPNGVSYQFQKNLIEGRNSYLAPAPLTADFTFRRQADSPVDFKVNMSGPGAENPFTGNRTTIAIDQQIGANFFAQAAYSEHDYRLQWGDPAVGLILYPDVALNLANGAPNPNVGKLYTQSVQRPEWFHRGSKETRFNAAYDLNLQERTGWKWLGRHQLSFLANKSEEFQKHDVFFEYNTTPLPGANPDIIHPSNRVIRRTYIDSSQQYLWGTPTVLQSIKAGQLNTKLIARAAPDSNKSVVNSLVEALQSRFWDGRIVTTLGWRQDSLKRFNGDVSAFVRDPITRDFARADTIKFLSAPTLERDLNSTSKGAVFHATKWAALTWNESENFNPSASFLDLFGKPLAAEGGTAKDYGIRLSLPNNRAYLSFNVFKNNQVNSVPGNFTYIRPEDLSSLRGLLILAGRNVNEITTQPNFGDTIDTAAEGQELELVANLTPDWRLSLSYTHTDVALSNAIPILGPWWDLNRPKFLALDQNALLPVSAGSVTTVARAIEWWDLVNVNTARSQVGRSPNAHRQENFSAVTNYYFRAGPLKNFSVGGKVRYYGKSQFTDRKTDRAYALAGLNIGYNTKLFSLRGGSKSVNCFVLLQINNITDFEGVIRGENDNRTYRQIAGRSASLSTSFKF